MIHHPFARAARDAISDQDQPDGQVAALSWVDVVVEGAAMWVVETTVMTQKLELKLDWQKTRSRPLSHKAELWAVRRRDSGYMETRRSRCSLTSIDRGLARA